MYIYYTNLHTVIVLMTSVPNPMGFRNIWSKICVTNVLNRGCKPEIDYFNELNCNYYLCEIFNDEIDNLKQIIIINLT